MINTFSKLRHLSQLDKDSYKKTTARVFPGGSGVKTLMPTNAEYSSSIPDPERFHVPWSNSACGLQLLSLCSRAWEPQLLGPCVATTEAWCPWYSTKKPQQ